MFLQKGDVFAPLIRDQAGRSAFGEPLIDVARTYLGSRQGPMRGRDGNIHRGCPKTGQLAMISHLGAMIPVVVGKLLAKRMKGEKGFVGLTTIGEGGMQTGATHEGMNIAAVEQVPLVIVATNNHYAYSTPNDRAVCLRGSGRSRERLRLRRQHGRRHGSDACLEVIGAAVKRARAGRPPQLVVASTSASGRPRRTRRRELCRRRHEDASRSRRIALQRAEQLILEQELAGSRRRCSKWRAEIAAEVDEAVATAQREAAPVGSEEDWCAISTRELVDQIP